MASKSSRKRRNKKRRQDATKAGHADQHVQVVLERAFDTAGLLSDVSKATDPAAEVERRIDDAATQFVEGFAGYDPLGTLEAIRMMTLPFAPAGVSPPASAQSGPAVAEVLAVVLRCAESEMDSGVEPKRVDQD
ncbi:MAG TPA: hypothetical protein PK331_04840 [Gordonia sp. (in: high G+C Gram-positive bacteria)]|jgi:hypothetical protein|uniref:Uncharacterized protein n=7 Tax=Gordonia TaxID=2053 RepID=M3V0G9_GORML|nr:MULTISPECIES: hypothetical protein [Gordonia]ALG86385.1 hypothetical protein ACH46_20175 [Gordonia phthalatica]AUH67569.1 hypothetical protein CXX93_03395 [Gordonia sp. YC-JH1]KXT56913.1 hypothetical protein Y710_10490 [Gordonia sp. QH-12]MBY4568409.1 hypothetical protein [Gordonia sihwensis]OPX08923.1 hypothetical protein B1964_25820 [Gordonia sp. i37]